VISTQPDHERDPSAIMAVFAQTDGPLRARGVCKAMDLDPAPNNINNVRSKLKRVTRRNILTEPEPGLFTLPRPQPSGEGRGGSAADHGAFGPGPR
jgi:hypothetical protein